MSAFENYQDFLQRQKKCMENPMSRIFVHQEKRYVKPFQIYGNVYYVGDDWVCVHLIDTGDGLLLIDSGNVCYTPWLVQAIWEMGFRPNDVKWLILSHGHIDHIGGAQFFRDTFGTQIYLSDADAQMFQEHPEFSFIQDSPSLLDGVFKPDVLIHEGDLLTFGNTQISCYLVPGHTLGCVALFFDAVNGQETKRCGYYGGFGFNTLTCQSLEEMGDTEYHTWQLYEDSIDKVIGQPVDIFLGNHTENNCTLEKYARLKAGCSSNPFIDSAEWRQYLGQKKAEFQSFREKELSAHTSGASQA